MNKNMLENNNKNLKDSKLFVYIFTPFLIIFSWHIITEFKFISPIFLPKPIEVVYAFFTAIKDQSLIYDLLYTIYRFICGFTIAVLIGVPVGLLMGYFKRVYNALEFTVEFFRSIPATALFPLFLLVFGIGDDAKIGISAWSATLVIIINTMYGVHSVKELRLKSAKVMNLKGFELFQKVIFMEALPQIFTGFRVGLSFALIVVIVTEMFIGTNIGLGHRIIDAQLSYRTDDMYMSILLTGIIGFSLNKILMFVENKVIHWKGK